MIGKVILWVLIAGSVSASIASAQTRPTDSPDFATVIAHHPAAKQLRALFPPTPAAVPRDFRPTGLTKADYLALAAGNVDFWRKYLDDKGTLIDPFEKAERQYSTPAFALAAAELVAHAGRDALLEPATRAFSFALTALVNKTTANQHPDFYIPMLMHAHRVLATRVSREQAGKWEEQFRSPIPEKNYKAIAGEGNWNLVNVVGEAMRAKDGLVAMLHVLPQLLYFDRSLGRQLDDFTRYGMYRDDNVPMAYDAFPRLWLADMLADGAYTGAHRQRLEAALTRGALSSLLLTSPSGEWANGGRSAQHQWNEAENAAICEISARYWSDHGRADAAASFKRAARLGLASMKRWQRPSGELWIVKNFAEPEQRFGFEVYSFQSQYNLLAMAMLCIAYERADDSIPERPIPSEYGSYVFDVRDTFHKVAAASGGYYVLIDTSADPHYDATGLLRVHRAGVELSPLSDSSAPDRSYEAGKTDPRGGLTPGIQWIDQTDGNWISLADFVLEKSPPKPPPTMPATTTTTTTRSATATSTSPSTAPTTAPAPPPPPPLPPRVVRSVELQVQRESKHVEFTLTYDLIGQGARNVRDHYVISDHGVQCSQSVAESNCCRFAFPVLVHDGANATMVTFSTNMMRVRRPGGELILTVYKPRGANWSLDWLRLATHNGYVQAAVREVPNPRAGVSWTVQLKPAAR